MSRARHVRTAAGRPADWPTLILVAAAVAVFIMVAAPGSSRSGSAVVFAPKTYTRSHGKPTVVTDRFSSRSQAAPEHFDQRAPEPEPAGASPITDEDIPF